MEGNDIASALCASFKDRPSYCQNDLLQQLVNDNIFDVNGDPNAITPLMWCFAIAFILFVNLGMLYIHKSFAKPARTNEI